MSKWDISINRGILTGYNEAFIIDEEIKNKLISEDPKSAELIRPILRGKDIKQYSYDFKDLWVIYVPCGFTNLNKNGYNAEKWFKSNYPSIYFYLVDTESKLSKNRNKKSKGLYKRDDQGDYWWELRSCKYLDDFNKQKIIYPETTQGAYFALDNNQYVIDKTCFMMTGVDNPNYLLASLSSSLFEYAYKRIFSSVELGNKGYQYNKHALIKLPILIVSLVPSETIKKINDLIDELIVSEEDSSKIINQINQIIFDLYSITSEEKKYIEKKQGKII